MKLSLFVFLISFSAFAQTDRIGADFLDSIKAEKPAKPKPAAKPTAVSTSKADTRTDAEIEAEAKAERERRRPEAVATAKEAKRVADLVKAAMPPVPPAPPAPNPPAPLENPAARVVQLVTRAQAAVKLSCNSYVSHDYSAAAPNFESVALSAPIVTAVDFRPSVPSAAYEFNPTIVIDTKSGWSVKDVSDTLAKASKIYAQCGIRIGAATVVSGTYSDRLRPIDSNSEAYMAAHMPQSAPKPWLFFIDHRQNNEFKDGGGKSFAQTSDSTRATFLGGRRFMNGSAFIAKDSLVDSSGKRNGYTPEIVVAHELAHILTDGDHQPGEKGDPRNLLANDGKFVTSKITANECAQMRQSPNVKKTKPESR